MKHGYLSQYFDGVAAKQLSAVEADPAQSNQHEFNGDEALKRLFGKTDGKDRYKTRFIYLSDDPEPVADDGLLTWYDARAAHPTRSEYRLYFTRSAVSDCAAAGDLLVIGRRPDGTVLVVIAESGSTVASQVQWLFGLGDLAHPGFSLREELETEQDRIAFASRFILEELGIEVEVREETPLEEILRRFDNRFPPTKIFSQYARDSLPDIRVEDGPDAALMAWMEREEVLFRTLERHLLAERLATGFDGDVDGFLSFSLSVQNRRKSRVGYALEHHMDAVLTAQGIRFTRTAVTENNSKPDFLFPGAAEYHSAEFPITDLRMLGVKSTCKDRWRQVLAEAAKVGRKHLLTLEASISQNQTNEMQAKQLQLVVPRGLFPTYSAAQQTWLQDVAGFSRELIEVQRRP